MAKIIRCFKCLIPLRNLKESKVADYLIQIVKEDGEHDYICPTCFAGW